MSELQRAAELGGWTNEEMAAFKRGALWMLKQAKRKAIGPEPKSVTQFELFVLIKDLEALTR